MTTEATGECPTCGTPYPAYYRAVRELLLAVHRMELDVNPDSYWDKWWIVEEMTRAMEKAVRSQMMEWLSGKPSPWLSALGMIGGGFGMAMVVAFLLAPQLGVLGNWNFSAGLSRLWAQIIAFGIIILSAVWYLVVKNRQKTRGINVDFAFKEIPPE